MSSPHILMTESLPPLIEPLSRRYELHRAWEASDRDGFLADVGSQIRGVVTGPKSRVAAELLDQLPGVELIAKVGAGYDLIDMEIAAQRGIIVTNTPGIPSPEVADFAMGLLISTVRRIPAAAAFLADGHWEAGTFFGFTESLRGRRVGIVGLGQIGLGVARRCEGFDLEVSYYGRSPKRGVPYRFHRSVVDLAKNVDTLIVTIAGGDDTRGLISVDVIDALGPQGIIINVSRGSVVDEPALLAALTEGRLVGAGLDVFDGEPARPEALIALPNTIVTPHVAAASSITVLEMCQHVVDNIDSWFTGQGPLSPVPETPWTAPDA